MLKPVGKRLIVKPIEQQYGTLVVVSKAKPTQFLVVSIGEEVTKAKPLDVIYLDKFAGCEIEHDKESFLVIDETSILAKVEA